MMSHTQISYGLARPEQIAGLGGREILQAMIDGALPSPPIAETCSLEIVEVGEGFAAFEGEPGVHLYNPMGIVHGGWALMLIDSAAGCAGQTLLPAGTGYTSVETKANFTRPIKLETGRVRCEARAVGVGRRIISAEAWLKSKDDKLLAHGTSTLMILGA